MKINPKKAAMIGLAATTLFTMSGCSTTSTPDQNGAPDMTTAAPTPEANEPETIYGPPEAFEETAEPAANENMTIYGPPEAFEQNTTPDSNENMEVYGPPEDMQ